MLILFGHLEIADNQIILIGLCQRYSLTGIGSFSDLFDPPFVQRLSDHLSSHPTVIDHQNVKAFCV